MSAPAYMETAAYALAMAVLQSDDYRTYKHEVDDCLSELIGYEDALAGLEPWRTCGCKGLVHVDLDGDKPCPACQGAGRVNQLARALKLTAEALEIMEDKGHRFPALRAALAHLTP